MTFYTSLPANFAQTPLSAKLALVVPCYNEAKRLNTMAFLGAVDQNAALHLIFVNDGSKDKTLDRLHALRELRPEKITVLDLPQNSGKAEAVRQGLQAAAKLELEYLGYWDADLATPMYAIEDMLKVADRLPDLQVVFGSRRNIIGHKIYRAFSRRLVSRMCAFMASLAVGLPLGDTQCGAKILRNTPEVRAALREPFSAGWLFDVELFTRISRQSKEPYRSFFEFPLVEWDEIPGSNVTTGAILKSGLVMARMIVVEFGVRVGRIFVRRPRNA